MEINRVPGWLKAWKHTFYTVKQIFCIYTPNFRQCFSKILKIIKFTKHRKKYISFHISLLWKFIFQIIHDHSFSTTKFSVIQLIFQNSYLHVAGYQFNFASTYFRAKNSVNRHFRDIFTAIYYGNILLITKIAIVKVSFFAYKKCMSPIPKSKGEKVPNIQCIINFR